MISRKKSRLVLFDLDDTLCDHSAAFDRWAACFADEHDLDRHETLLWLTAERGRNPSFEEYHEALRHHFGLGDFFRVEDLWHGIAGQYRCADGVLDGLMALRAAGAVVGVVTNGPPSQEEKIRSSGLDAVVDGYAISMVEGIGKPDAEIFRRAAINCGTTLGAVRGGFMVGDNALADIGGARNAALSSIWVTLGREWLETDFRPDHQVAHVRDGIDVVLRSMS